MMVQCLHEENQSVFVIIRNIQFYQPLFFFTIDNNQALNLLKYVFYSTRSVIIYLMEITHLLNY